MTCPDTIRAQNREEDIIMNGTDAKGAVLVTGGSRGIGARTVVRLAEAGFYKIASDP